MAETFNLPDVGEGLTEAEIVSWRVAIGDTVEVNDIIVEIETAKSLVELPVPYAGVVRELLAAEGETIEVGNPLIRVGDPGEAPDESPSGDQAQEGPESAAASSAHPQPAEAASEGSSQGPARKGGARGRSARAGRKTPVKQTVAGPDQSPAEDSSGDALVGSGPKADSTKRRPRTRATQPDVVDLSGLDIPRDAGRPPGGELAELVAKASPPVRALAKRLGVAAWELVGSGRNGQITRDDVERQARQRDAERESGRVPSTGAPRTGQGTAIPADLGLLYAGPREDNVQVRGVRKATAVNVSESASSVPHVSVFKEVDVTRTMELRAALKKDPSYEGLSVTPMLFAAKAIIWAARRNPQINASWHTTHYTLKNYVNLGIAAATPRGLVVPIVHDAQTYNTRGLAAAITQLTIDARQGKTTVADMQGGTISITNVGPLGLDSGTPILPAGQAAIVVLGAVRRKPWVVEERIVPRDVMTIGGSFDHRLIDGDLAGHFVSDIAAVMEEPGLLLE